MKKAIRKPKIKKVEVNPNRSEHNVKYFNLPNKK